MIEIIGDLIMFGCGVALLAAFLVMKITQNYLVFESSPLILWAEIGMCLGIMGLGLNRLVNDLKRYRQ